LIDGGYSLKDSEIELKCSICSKGLEVPFYYCKTYKKFLCIECNKKNPCIIRKEEHEHIHVIKK